MPLKTNAEHVAIILTLFYLLLCVTLSLLLNLLLNLRGQCHENFDFRFLVMNHFSPSPWVSQKARFRKIVEIFTAQGAPPVSLTTVANGKNL
jgi:hypothetical protein